MQKVSFVTLCYFSLFLALPKANAAVCYSVQEAEADAALRFEAELRITGLSCRLPDGDSLYPAYQKFVAGNQSLLQHYQDQLVAFYKAHNKGSAPARLHTRETDIENEMALAAARQGTSLFCQTHAAELQNAAAASDGEVQSEIKVYEASHPATIKTCASLPSR